MRKSLKINGLFFIAAFFLVPAILLADQEKWVFLPVTPLFQPLIGDPREPDTGIIAYTSQNRFEGSVGSTVEFLRWMPPDRTQWGWGILGAGYILLDEYGAAFPMRDNDWYAGMYLSEASGSLSYRLEFVHQSSHLGDSLDGYQNPIIYNGENFNLTAAFQPTKNIRAYAGLGAWENFYPPDNAFFASLGTEIYSPPMDFLGASFRVYGTCHLKWKGQAGGVLNKTAQFGFQWKFNEDETRTVRLALVYYNGNYEFGQFYLGHDEHLGIGIYFDP